MSANKLEFKDLFDRRHHIHGFVRASTQFPDNDHTVIDIDRFRCHPIADEDHVGAFPAAIFQKKYDRCNLSGSYGCLDRNTDMD